MKSSLEIKLGEKTLTISGEGTDTGIIKALSFWSQLPAQCGKCKSSNIALNHKSPKGNDYYGLKCLSCTAELNFHQKKEGGAFYLTKDDVWEIWQKDNKTASPVESEETPF